MFKIFKSFGVISKPLTFGLLVIKQQIL